MMHLKNIKAGNAKTLEQYELTKKHGVIWLYSEDGKNWYEEVSNFQEDTIKIVYDENNIIVGITRDASTLNPEGFSNNRPNHKRPRYFPKLNQLSSRWNAPSG